ncbi:MAG: ankyrin repeat domain-containing protein [Rickettsiales bacterium]
MRKVIFTCSFFFIASSALAADPNFDNWSTSSDFDFNIQTRDSKSQQAPKLVVPSPNQPAQPAPVQADSKLEVKKSPEVSEVDVPNPPMKVKAQVAPDEQLNKDLEDVKVSPQLKTKTKKPVVIKEVKRSSQPKRYNAERKSIDVSEPVAAFFDENVLLENEFKPNGNETRRIFDPRQAPSKFIQNMPRTDDNSHLPNLVYQKEFSELLFAAVARDDVGAINSLLARGGDINARIASSGVTPLISSIKANNIRTIRYLLTRGADQNVKTNDGKTPIHFAAIANNIEVFNLLLTAGAKALVTDNSGKYPLDYVSQPTRQAFELAVAQHVTDKNTAMLDFVGTKSVYPVTYLIDAGADVNFREATTGDTALIKAARNNNLEMVNLLLAKNGNINLVNKKGETALKIAQLGSFVQIASVIDTVAIRNELESSLAARKFESYKDVVTPVVTKPATAPVILPHVIAPGVVHTGAVAAAESSPMLASDKPWVNAVNGFFTEISDAINSVSKPWDKATPVEVQSEKLPELSGSQTIIYNKPAHQVAEPFVPKQKLPPNVVKKVIRDGEEVAKSGAGDWVRVPTQEEMQPTSILPDELD